ncbi:MAG: NAD(P)H-dependent oxidoreductase [Pseudomonadota bacterium]
MTTILHVDSSGRVDGSHSRRLSSELVDRLTAGRADARVIHRDVSAGLPVVDQGWIEANFTPEGARTPDQKARLTGSDDLVAELENADVIVIGVPIYNFSVPASLKAWIDQICRAGLTFRFGPEGPVGLLDGKRAYLVVASGGTEVEGPIDFATGYLRHVLGFIGVRDVTVVNAGRRMADEEAAEERALQTIAEAA